MRIAFLCLTHNNFDYLAKLSSYYCSDGDNLFIHVDKRVKQIPKDKFDVNTIFVSDDNRKKTRWGSYEIVEASLELIKLAMNFAKFDRYILISGSDFPLEKKETLKSKINNNFEYICIWDTINFSSDKKNLWLECFKYHNHKIFNYGECRKNKLKLKLSILLRKVFYLLPSNNKKEYFDYAKGSQWWCVSHDLACLFLLKENKKTFSSMHAPDEKYFHTIVFNSDFNERVILNHNQYESKIHALHYVNWPDSYKDNLNFNIDDIDDAISNNAFFVRKVNQHQHDAFLEYLGKLL